MTHIFRICSDVHCGDVDITCALVMYHYTNKLTTLTSVASFACNYIHHASHIFSYTFYFFSKMYKFYWYWYNWFIWFKVAEKLCHYYLLCKKGEHFAVAEEIESIKLPKVNVTCGDGYNDKDMEIEENGVSLIPRQSRSTLHELRILFLTWYLSFVYDVQIMVGNSRECRLIMYCLIMCL